LPNADQLLQFSKLFLHVEIVLHSTKATTIVVYLLSKNIFYFLNFIDQTKGGSRGGITQLDQRGITDSCLELFSTTNDNRSTNASR
ncbi:hypothetical protein T06_15701, partial [Trichinella sp. T6]